MHILQNDGWKDFKLKVRKGCQKRKENVNILRTKAFEKQTERYVHIYMLNKNLLLNFDEYCS